MAPKRTLDSFFSVTSSREQKEKKQKNLSLSASAADETANSETAAADGIVDGSNGRLESLSSSSCPAASTTTPTATTLAAATPAASSTTAACTPESSKPSTTATTTTALLRSHHPSYPFPILHLPAHLAIALNDELPASPGRQIADRPDLDLLYFQPYVPASIEHELFCFLRRELFYYRVRYMTKRAGVDTEITTPRFTTVFGVDSTSFFDPSGALRARPPNPPPAYHCTPRPLPHCLDTLRQLTELFTGAAYNFCLINYYASGADSISYHSDDERFLGPDPVIASLSLGARRQFYMRRKAAVASTANAAATAAALKGEAAAESKPRKVEPVKLALGSGDLVLMRGRTQASWEHSVPKRSGTDASSGRINITFRKAMARGGTENYYHYNVGDGLPWRWDPTTKQMKEWKG